MSPNSLVHQKILDQANVIPDALAILAPGKKPMTYQVLARHIVETALDLNRLGIRAGERVAVVLPNGPEMATAFLAVSSVCTCAPLNPAYPLEEFKTSMRELQVKVLLTDDSIDHPCRRAAAELGIPVIRLAANGQVAGLFNLEHDLPLDEAIDSPLFLEADDVALVLQTSGTTSRPKIVPVSQRILYHTSWSVGETFALTPDDRSLNMMPLFHISGLAVNITGPLLNGGSAICTPGFSAQDILSWLIDLQPTYYSAVPVIQQAILDQVLQDGKIAGKTKLRFIRSVSAPIPPKLARDLEGALAVPVIEAFGMTEGNHLISNPLPPQERKIGSVGLPTPGNQAGIFDQHGNPLPANTVGEICVRGVSVITHYENNPSVNQAAFFDGWLRTGDLGYADDDGYFYIKSRLKEQINRGGEKVAPREIDEVLLQHPAVKQAAAFAIPHPTLGEDVAAAVVLEPDQEISLQELRQFTSKNLVDYKVPRLIVFVRDIPKGPTGKVQRVRLAEALATELEAARNQDTGWNGLPETELERQLLQIWQQVLEQDSLGVQDDFLALGGDSIKAARLLMLASRAFAVNLSMRDIFAVPTVRSMADYIVELRESSR